MRCKAFIQWYLEMYVAYISKLAHFAQTTFLRPHWTNVTYQGLLILRRIKPWIIFAKSFILDVWQGSACAFDKQATFPYLLLILFILRVLNYKMIFFMVKRIFDSNRFDHGLRLKQVLKVAIFAKILHRICSTRF